MMIVVFFLGGCESLNIQRQATNSQPSALIASLQSPVKQLSHMNPQNSIIITSQHQGSALSNLLNSKSPISSVSNLPGGNNSSQKQVVHVNHVSPTTAQLLTSKVRARQQQTIMINNAANHRSPGASIVNIPSPQSMRVSPGQHQQQQQTISLQQAQPGTSILLNKVSSYEFNQ
jgi:hypothetical protein